MKLEHSEALTRGFICPTLETECLKMAEQYYLYSAVSECFLKHRK